MGAEPSYLVISAALVMLITPIGMAIAVYLEGGVSSILSIMEKFFEGGCSPGNFKRLSAIILNGLHPDVPRGAVGGGRGTGPSGSLGRPGLHLRSRRQHRRQHLRRDRRRSSQAYLNGRNRR